ncbi:MAG: transcriptional regulator [Prosthecochloris sp.]|nr:transcriptional regulator [Prosthecochloris sp.]
MKQHSEEFISSAREKFGRYRELVDQLGDDAAREESVVRSVAIQRERMTPFISGRTLAEGFGKAVPFFEKSGMEMEVHDISNDRVDGVLEIQKHCPYLGIYRDYGFSTPCEVICDIDVEAIGRAFPSMRGAVLSRLACGDCACVFKYERPQERNDR